MAEGNKQGFLMEDFRLFHLSSRQGVTTELHYHTFCKILFFLRGKGEYLIDGQRYSLQPGDIILVGAGSVHRAALSREEPYERIILYLLPEFLQAQSSDNCDLPALFSGVGGHVIRPGNEKLSRLARSLERDLNATGFGKELLCRSELLMLLVQLGRFMASPSFGPKPLIPRDPRVQQILSYLDDHITEELRIDDLAKRFYVSKYHMMRSFRADTGISIHQYITQKRLLLARSYLASGMNATESCYRSGFGSYSSFTRASAKLLGTSPTGRLEPEMEE